MAPKYKKFLAIRDSKEKEGFGWTFEGDERCLGTERRNLPTGDYSIDGLEKVFTIERKLSTAEVYQNITEKRFTRELERFKEFAHTFVICEFTMQNIMEFPLNSGIPRHKWPLLNFDGKYVLKCLNEIMIKYNTSIVYAGAHGKDVAISIMKRMNELYGNH